MGLTGGGPPPHPDPPSMAGINHAQMCKIRASAIQARFALQTFRRAHTVLAEAHLGSVFRREHMDTLGGKNSHS